MRDLNALLLASLMACGLVYIASNYFSYNAFGKFGAKPVVGEMYLCNEDRWATRADNVTQVLATSVRGDSVRAVSVPLSNGGGDIVQTIDIVTNVQTYALTMDNFHQKVVTQIDNFDKGTVEWDTLYTLADALRGFELYNMTIQDTGSFQANCKELTQSDIINFWVK